MVEKISALMAVLIISLVCSLTMGYPVALAHQVNVFAWVEEDTIYVQSKFSGGKKVKAGQIRVLDPQGKKLLSGMTDNQGDFSFRIPQRTDLKIVLNAGQGHRGEWVIRAADMQETTPKTLPYGNTDPAGQPTKESKVFEEPAVSKAPTPTGRISREELEGILEAVLDRKLKPITKMWVDARESGPTFKDIIAGFGYIVGLVGLAVYIQNRKKSK